MALHTVNTGDTINNTDINQFTNVLQQPALATEIGRYRVSGWGNANGDNISTWVNSLSRISVPTGVTVDTTDQAPSNCNAPTATNFNAGGFQIFSTMTGAFTSGFCGGKYTLQF